LTTKEKEKTRYMIRVNERPYIFLSIFVGIRYGIRDGIRFSYQGSYPNVYHMVFCRPFPPCGILVT
jgi:hypothetical protein